MSPTIAFQFEMTAPDFGRNTRNQARRAGAVAAMDYLKSKLKDRWDKSVQIELGFEERSMVYKKRKSKRKPGTGNLAHLFSGKQRRSMIYENQVQIGTRLSKLSFPVHEGYARSSGKVQRRNRDEIVRTAKREERAMAEVYAKAATEYLNTQPAKRPRKVKVT